MSEGFFSRGFRGRRRQTESDVSLPPGQYLVEGFPVLSAGPTPRTPVEEWDFSIVGEVDQPTRWTEMMRHTDFHTKLQAVGFGVFIPFFFVTSGMELDVRALLSGGATLALVPVFVLALLLARGLPAALYRPMVGSRGSLAAALLQATSLPFIVAATGIGMELGILSPAIGAAMVVAGLLSVVLFPLGALTLLRGGRKPTAVVQRDGLDDAGGDEPGPT